MAGFVNAFKGFQDDVKQSLQQQEERLTMLDRKTMSYARPALSAHTEMDLSHKKALGAYLRTGDDDGLRGLNLEGKAMSTAVSADGGYLLNPQMSGKHPVDAVVDGLAAVDRQCGADRRHVV